MRKDIVLEPKHDPPCVFLCVDDAVYSQTAPKKYFRKQHVYIEIESNADGLNLPIS